MDYNNPDTWLDAAIHDAPAFAIADYQRRINEICGLNQFGGPNVKLVWMPWQENYTRYYCEWDAAGFGTKTELRCQYVFITLSDGKGNELQVPPPRWALKQFNPPAQYMPSEPFVRFKKRHAGKKRFQDDPGDQTFVREIRPERPATGYYSPLVAIGAHTPWCCKTAKKNGATCWGRYRTPDDAHLVLLREAVELRAKENADRPDAGLTPKLMASAALEAARKTSDREEAADRSMEELIVENLPSMLAYYLNDKSFLDAKTAYSFASEKTSGGIIVPRI